MLTRPARSADARSVSARGPAAAARSSSRSPVPSRTASRARRARAGRSLTLDANRACRRLLRGSIAGSGWAAVRCGPLRAADNSSRASGFPRGFREQPLPTRSASAGKRAPIRAVAAASSSGRISYRGRSPRSKKPSCPDREAARNPTGTSASRRVTSPRTAPVDRSSHCRSSMTSSSGREAAACRSKASTALTTVSRSAGAPSTRPKATLSASRCDPSSRLRSSSSGRRSWLRPEKLMSASNSAPPARRHPQAGRRGL